MLSIPNIVNVSCEIRTGGNETHNGSYQQRKQGSYNSHEKNFSGNGINRPTLINHIIPT